MLLAEKGRKGVPAPVFTLTSTTSAFLRVICAHRYRLIHARLLKKFSRKWTARRQPQQSK
jgi:hypothetical protein